MNSDLHTHYLAVLAAEKTERDKYYAELKRLQVLIRQKDSVIAALTASVATEELAARALTKPLPFQQPIGLGALPAPSAPESLPYAGISVRWAILSLMSDYTPTDEVLGPAEMAEVLQAGGVRSGGVNFVANVSAVVSDMVNKRNELEPTGDGKYRITSHGCEVWQSIKTSYRYKNRRYGWSAQEGQALP